MSKPYWHIHHEVLMEFNTEPIENRIEYIKEYKNSEEIPIRLQLLKPVQGKLPSAVVEAQDVFYEAWDAYIKAQDAYIKAQDASSKAQNAYYKDKDAYYKAQNVYYKALNAFNKAQDVYYKAKDAFNKARDARNKALKDNELEIEALHRIECPNCPWNGKTIFPDT